MRRHVADLVQEQRAAVRLFELAGVPRGRSRERAFLVPEQLGFDQFRRHRRAVQRNERAIAALAFLMQRARDQLLAGSGFAQNRHASFARRHALHLRHDALHHRRFPDQFLLACALAQALVLVFQTRQLHRVLDGDQQLFGGERLLQKIHRAQTRGPHRHLDAGLPGDHHHRRRHARRLQFGQQREPVLARHHDVRENHVEALRLREFQRAVGLIAHHRLMPGQAKSPRQRCQRIRVVVHQQQFAHVVVFNSIRNVVPLPGSLCTVIVPL